jgi:O-antigen ligase
VRRLPRFAAIQGTLLVLVTVVLIQPSNIPDPFGAGDLFSWTVLCVLASLPVLVSAVRLRLPATTFDPFLAVYLACTIAVLAFSVDRVVSATWLLALVANVAVFYGTVLAARGVPPVPPLVLALIVIGVAVLQVIAFEFHAEQGFAELTRAYARPEGWNGYPELGLLACIQLAILLAIVQTVSQSWARLAAAILILVTFVELTFLYSRMAWVTAGAVVLVAVISGVSSRAFLRWGAGIAVVAIILAVASGQTEAGRTIRARFTEPSTVEGRLQIWERTSRMIQDHLLTGVGAGNFQAVYEPVYNPDLNPDLRRGGHAHNLWLQQAAESGVVTAAASLALWIAVLVTGWRQRHGSWVQRAAFLIVVTVAVRSLGDYMFFSTGGAPARLHTLTWIAFGILAAGALPVVKTR